MMLGPYELNSIVTGDARELSKAIPDNSVDLAFVDPPYWVGFDYGHARDNDLGFIDPAWLVGELRRVSRISFVTPGIANIWDYPKADWVLGWFKFGGTGRSGFGGFNVWEPILVYGQLSRSFWQDGVSIPTYRNHLNINGAYHIIKNACPKPEPLISWLIEGASNPGNIVLDLMAGTGTTPVIAKKLGRHYLAFEIDPATANRARERVQMTQPPLFVAMPEQIEMEIDDYPAGA